MGSPIVRLRGPDEIGNSHWAWWSFVLFVIVYGIAVLTVPGQWLDDEALGLVQRIPPDQLRAGLPVAARVALPFGVMIVLALVAGWGLVHRNTQRVLTALAIPLVSVPLARLLRMILPRPDHGYSYVVNTLPSTHVAIVASAAVVIAMMWPARRPRWLVMSLGVVVLVACLGNVVGHAHRPSDVVASVLLVAAVAGASRGASRWLDRR